MTLDQAALDAEIRSSPANAWLGLHTVALDDDELHLRLPWRREFADGDTISIADGALMLALNASCGYLVVALTGRGGAIANLRCDVLERCGGPGHIDIHASALRLGRQLSSITAEAYDAEGRRLAVARCTYFLPDAAA